MGGVPHVPAVRGSLFPPVTACSTNEKGPAHAGVGGGGEAVECRGVQAAGCSEEFDWCGSSSSSSSRRKEVSSSRKKKKKKKSGSYGCGRRKVGGAAGGWRGRVNRVGRCRRRNVRSTVARSMEREGKGVKIAAARQVCVHVSAQRSRVVGAVKHATPNQNVVVRKRR